MIKRSIPILLLALCLGCSTTPNTSVKGDASASMRTGEIITETTTVTAPDGTVTVTVSEICEGCQTEETVGDPHSNELYKTAVSIVGAFLSIASIVVQALR